MKKEKERQKAGGKEERGKGKREKVHIFVIYLVVHPETFCDTLAAYRYFVECSSKAKQK
jgi:hypothetical protein